MKKAVFFDRDGVLNVDTDYITSHEKFKLYNGVGDAISHCRKLGYMVFVITNQPAIARGLITETELDALHSHLQELILGQNPDAIIDKFFYCPHHPNANLPEYRTLCECRKPKSGMISAARSEFNIDTALSYMIGDRPSDIIAGCLAGCRTIQCLTGKHSETMIQTDLHIPENIKPDFTIANISEIKEIIA